MFAESVSALRLKGYRAKCIMVFFFFSGQKKHTERNIGRGWDRREVGPAL